MCDRYIRYKHLAMYGKPSYSRSVSNKLKVVAGPLGIKLTKLIANGV